MRTKPVKHRIPKGFGWGIAKTRNIASLDISEESGEGKFYTRNYLNLEPLIMDALKMNIITVSLDKFDIFY